jgi:hypothetical protein
MRTVPVNQSAGPLLDGCEPILLISICSARYRLSWKARTKLKARECVAWYVARDLRDISRELVFRTVGGTSNLYEHVADGIDDDFRLHKWNVVSGVFVNDMFRVGNLIYPLLMELQPELMRIAILLDLFFANESWKCFWAHPGDENDWDSWRHTARVCIIGWP